MSDKKLIAVIGDYGFTSYPLMTACLNSVIQNMKLNPKDVAIVNSRCRGAETHAASYCIDELCNDPVAVEMPWLDLSEPCEIGLRAQDQTPYNKLAGVKRDNAILAMPNLVGVVFFHQAGSVNKQLTLNHRFPRLVTGSKVPTYVFQLGAKLKGEKRIETLLLPNQALPDPFIPTRDLIRDGTGQRRFSDQAWVTRVHEHVEATESED